MNTKTDGVAPANKLQIKKSSKVNEWVHTNKTLFANIKLIQYIQTNLS